MTLRLTVDPDDGSRRIESQLGRHERRLGELARAWGPDELTSADAHGVA